MSAEILVVAPYPELAELASKMQEEIDFSYDIIVGNLNETWQSVEESLLRGVKVVVSRGGTAQYLRKHMEIPVVDIPVTSSDILTAVSEVNRKGIRKIAFITTKNIIVKTEHFSEIPDLSLWFEPVEDMNDIPDKVRHLIKQGFEAIVGDVTATRQAYASGIVGQLLKSGQDALLYSLQEAHKMLVNFKKEQARIKQMEAILNMMSEAVLAIDKRSNVVLYNTAASRIFGQPKESVLTFPLAECLPESKLAETLLRQTEEKNLLIEMNKKKIISNRMPILIDKEVHGAVAIFSEISNIQKLELNIRTQLADRGLVAKRNFSEIENNSLVIRHVITQARQYANSEGTVLIYGETGTGKEVFAQSIHNGSRRANGPFVSINCAALTESLLESELFGYESGAFTGASKRGKQGLFELAHGGSIFLDEIGEISPNFQAMLLRVLQEKEIRRIGGDRVIPIDVRIICATNRDLQKEIKEQRFREDLYYRLTVLEIKLPALRERKEDIVPIAIACIRQECARENKKISWADENIFQDLLQYEWPGNIRELQNFINRLVICSRDGELTRSFIIGMLAVKNKTNTNTSEETLTIPIREDIKQMENDIVIGLLKKFNGDKERLCKEYGLSKTTLWRKLNFKNEI